MKKLIIILITLLLISNSALADCEGATKKCKSECWYMSIFNNDNSQYIDANKTDFVVNCENSCNEGKRYCQYESSLSDGCYQFKRKCNNNCPSSIYIGSEYLYNTDANSKCEDSCRAGYRYCE